MAVLVDWNGVDVPEELKAQKKGRYVLVPLDDPPSLAPKQASSSAASSHRTA